ncbi:MAG: glycosyltransferase family 2 protein [Vicinamibacteria bacterium]
MSAQVAVVVVTHDSAQELPRSLGSLADCALPLEVVVFDNASRDGSADVARRLRPGARVIECPDNLGFGAANNRAFAESTASLLLLLNPDAELRTGALEALATALALRPELAAVGPVTRNTDGSLQLSFGEDLTLASEWRRRRLERACRAGAPWALAEAERRAASEAEPFWISGSCLLARREALAQVGGFDEAFFLYEEDVDLCARLRAAGWRIGFRPEAEVVHHRGRSVGRVPARASLEYHRSHLLYYRKHRGPLERLALRAWLATRALLLWSRAALSGNPDGRRQQAALLGLAVRG